MTCNSYRSLALAFVLSVGITPDALTADADADGISDDSGPFVDTDDDGIHDLRSSSASALAVPLATTEPDPPTTRDVLIVHQSRPLAYFGWYRTSQMTPPGFDLLESMVDWLVSSKAPGDTRLLLFSYDGSVDTCTTQNADAAALYRFLVDAGYTDIEVQHQRAAAYLKPSYYNDFDAVLYWNFYGHDIENILASGIPLMSTATAHGAQMGISTGLGPLHEFRDTTHVFDANHPGTDAFPLGALAFAAPMWTNPSQATPDGRALVVADPLPEALEVAIDIEPYREVNVVKPLRNRRIAVALLGSDRFGIDSVDTATLRFGPDLASPWRPDRAYRRDVNRDGWLDLVLHFATRDTGIRIADTGACLNGATKDGRPLRGCAGLTTRPASKWVFVGE